MQGSTQPEICKVIQFLADKVRTSTLKTPMAARQSQWQIFFPSIRPSIY
jgi:hypothetical protein